MGERFGTADRSSSRAMLDIEGAAGVDEVVIAVDETDVDRRLRSLSDVGATEMIAVPFGSPDQVDGTLAVMSAGSPVP